MRPIEVGGVSMTVIAWPSYVRLCVSDRGCALRVWFRLNRKRKPIATYSERLDFLVTPPIKGAITRAVRAAFPGVRKEH